MTKSFHYFLFFLIFIVSCPVNFAQIGLFDYAEQLSFKPDTVAPVEFPFQRKFNFNYSNIAGLNAGTVGAIYFNGKYYFNRWNGEACYTLLPDATGAPDSTTIEIISSPPYLGNIRDMTIAPDASGELFLWGGTGSNILYKMDEGMNVITQYTLANAAIRAIAWDPVTGGFWCSNFSDQGSCYDTLGTLLATSPNSALFGGKYGAGFSNSTQLSNNNSVWWWSQINTSGELVHIDLESDSILGNYVFADAGLAGGAEVCNINGELVLLLNFQNVSLSGYVLGPVSDVNEHVISNYTYTLAQNYPNPFNPSTVINYTIQETGLVQLRVYDILGSEISELVNEVKGPGNHSVVFNAANLAGGVYIYSINISGYKSSKKMVLIK